MHISLRSTLLGAGLLIGGTLAGPALFAAAEGSTPTPVPAESQSAQLAEAGAPSVFVPIVAYRAFDSREQGDIGKLTVDGEVRGPMPSVTEFFADLDENGELAIPGEAIGVTYNVTVAQTEGVGFIAIDKNNFFSGTSAVNWVEDGQQPANSGSVLLGQAGLGGGGNGTDSVQVSIGGEPGARAHVIVDITGYYLPANT